MSEEHTQDFDRSRSFEERIFVRFDSMEAHFNRRFDSLDERVEALETKVEKRALETKPIWERALAEILEVKQGLEDVVRKIDILSRDIVKVASRSTSVG